MVLLIASEGKKWGLHYHHTGYGGKKWEKMFSYVGVKVGKGIVPRVTPSLTFCQIKKKLSPTMCG